VTALVAPNILAIFYIAPSKVHYTVTELLEGET
jgi:hypothetical protein